MIELVAFWVLFAGTALTVAGRRALRHKPVGDWILDLTGLAVQGGAIPLLRIAVVVGGLALLAPQWQGTVRLPGPDWAVGFVLSFVGVDYLYYWNHRALHSRRLWPVHLVHHTIRDMDVLGTARNTVWTSLLFVYLWVNGVMIFLLAEPAGYLIGVTATAALDLWRHTALGPRPDGRVGRAVRTLFITPHDHAWHHARDGGAGNYGANLSVWDRLHGTFVSRPEAPAALGVDTELSLTRKLVWPLP